MSFLSSSQLSIVCGHQDTYVMLIVYLDHNLGATQGTATHSKRWSKS